MALFKRASEPCDASEHDQNQNKLGDLLDRVKADAPVPIVDPAQPVARLEPVTRGPDEQDARLARLPREGLVRPRRNAPPRALLTSPPPRTVTGASIVNMLIQERREGR